MKSARRSSDEARFLDHTGARNLCAHIGRGAAALGVIEVVGGILLFIIEIERGTLMYFVLVAWALCGGLVLILDALYLRRQARFEASTQADQMPME